MVESQVADWLATDVDADEVKLEIDKARRMGVQGVPFFIIDKSIGVSGAQPADVLVEAIDYALAQRKAPAGT